MGVHPKGHATEGPAASAAGSGGVRLHKVKFTHKMRRPGHVEAMADFVSAEELGNTLELQVVPHARVMWSKTWGDKTHTRYVPIEHVEFYEEATGSHLSK